MNILLDALMHADLRQSPFCHSTEEGFALTRRRVS